MFREIGVLNGNMRQILIKQDEIESLFLERKTPEERANSMSIFELIDKYNLRPDSNDSEKLSLPIKSKEKFDLFETSLMSDQNFVADLVSFYYSSNILIEMKILPCVCLHFFQKKYFFTQINFKKQLTKELPRLLKLLIGKVVAQNYTAQQKMENKEIFKLTKFCNIMAGGNSIVDAHLFIP